MTPIGGRAAVPALRRRRRAWRRRGERRLDPQAGLEELRAQRSEQPTAASRRAGAAGGGAGARPRGGRPRWRRALRWALPALAAWIGVSVVLFVVSSLSAAGVPPSAAGALDGGGLPIVSSTTTLVLGSDARPAGSKEPGADPTARAART